MNKKTTLLLALSSGLLLAACGTKTPVESGSIEPSAPLSEPSTPDSGASSSVAREVLSKIGTSLSVSGTVSTKIVQGEMSFDMDTLGVATVLTPEYCYTYLEYVDYEDMPGEGTRYENVDGYAVVEELDPVTNTVEQYNIVDRLTGEVLLYSELFANPFSDPSMFAVEDSKLVLEDVESFDAIALSKLLAGGGAIGSLEPTIASLEIPFDEEGNPTGVTALLKDLTYEEYGEVSEYTVELAVVDPAEVGVPERIAPLAAQAGQEKLAAMFARLRQCNYTITVIDIMEGGPMPFDEEEEEEWGEGEAMMNSGTAYVTPESYFVVYPEGSWLTPHGVMAVEGGYAEYELRIDEESAELVQTKVPYLQRDPAYYFGKFNYDARCFNVEEDGSFTLATAPGLYNPVFDELLPDPNVVSVAYPDAGSLNFFVDEANDTLSYTYTGFSGTETFMVIIEDIGTTELPVDLSAVTPYVPSTNWTEYAAADSWNQDFVTALGILTNGHADDIPFVETPYSYLRTFNDESIYHEPEDPEMWWMGWSETIYVYDMSIIWEFDTAEEASAARETFLKAMTEGVGTSLYTEVAQAEGSIAFDYHNVDGGHVGVELTPVLTDVNAWDETFAYAVGFFLTNLNEYVPA